jgi:hypothetical protein
LALRNCLVEMDGREGNLLGFITDAEVKELVRKVKDRVNNAKTPNRVNLEVAFRHSLIDGKTGETLGYLVPKEDLPNMELKADTHAVKLVRDRDTVNFEDALRWTFGIEGVKCSFFEEAYNSQTIKEDHLLCKTIHTIYKTTV